MMIRGLPVTTAVQYLEAVAVAFLAATGVLAGLGLRRLRGRFWMLGYLLPLLIVVLVGATRRFPALEFIPPFSPVMAGRTEFVALGFACTTLLTSVLVRLSRKGERALIGIFMTIAALYLSVLPFAFPPLLRNYQLNLNTNFDSYGVCLQSNYFNCGPAATVTALKALGISASEGEIAVLAQTNPASGTQPDILCAALQEAYGKEGLTCEYRLFGSVAELENFVPAIVLIKLNPVTDHHVAVLEVSDDAIVLGDPLEGRRTLSRTEFERIWRHSAIVFRQDPLRTAEVIGGDPR